MKCSPSEILFIKFVTVRLTVHNIDLTVNKVRNKSAIQMLRLLTFKWAHIFKGDNKAYVQRNSKYLHRTKDGAQ